ncbi:ABC transporter substrate-binding protein [Sporomusa aerivorans]|uniref:ABC transporter substrate-binding protein n=1 Tax=Sporomusa aerivorans TaxID=204936 RepID=UPI00352A28DF
MKNNVYSTSLICVILVIASLFVYGCGSKNAAVQSSAATQVIEDSLGRKVEIPAPVKRVVVSNSYIAELINCIGALDAIVGVDYGIYEQQDIYRGRFNENSVIGKSTRELNYEKIIELKPDALLITGNGAWAEAEKKLADFGIKVIVIDIYYTDKFAENCLLAGKIFGKEKEAQAYYHFFAEKLNYVKEQLRNVPKKRVYFEYKREGNTTIPGDYFARILEYANTENIFADAKNVQVNADAVIMRNPDYIVRVGKANVVTQHKPPAAGEFAQIKQEIMARPGWSEINAVKNGNIFLLSHYAQGGASKITGTLFLAKYLYPKELPDLNPEAVFKEWLTQYQHLEYRSGHTYPAFELNN